MVRRAAKLILILLLFCLVSCTDQPSGNSCLISKERNGNTVVLIFRKNVDYVHSMKVSLAESEKYKVGDLVYFKNVLGFLIIEEKSDSDK